MRRINGYLDLKKSTVKMDKEDMKFFEISDGDNLLKCELYIGYTGSLRFKVVDQYNLRTKTQTEETFEQFELMFPTGEINMFPVWQYREEFGESTGSAILLKETVEKLDDDFLYDSIVHREKYLNNF